MCEIRDGIHVGDPILVHKALMTMMNTDWLLRS